VIERVYYIRFPTSDLKRAVSFYENILGLKKTAEWPSGAIFDVGGVQFGLEVGQKLEIFLLVDDVDKVYQRLKEKGVKFVTEPKDQHWGARTATMIDSEGNMFTLEHFTKKETS